MNVASALSRLSQLVVLALVLTGSHAFGQATLTQMQSFTDVSGTTPIPFSFATFDPSQGTLNSVTIELINVSLTGTAQGTNDLPSDTEDILVNLTGNIKVSAASGTSNPNLNLTVIDNQGNEDLVVAPGASTPVYNYSNSSTLNTQGAPSSTVTAVTPYIDNGSANITVTVTPNHIGVTGSAFDNSTGNAATATFTGSATVSGTLEVIYNYTAAPVPEPSKTAACMIGFALCVLVGRNYFKSRALRLA